MVAESVELEIVGVGELQLSAQHFDALKQLTFGNAGEHERISARQAS